MNRLQLNIVVLCQTETLMSIGRAMLPLPQQCIHEVLESIIEELINSIIFEKLNDTYHKANNYSL